MTDYEISNKHSGMFLGVYEAEDEADALDVLARDAGYRDYEDACTVAVIVNAGELIVVEVRE